MKTLYHLCPDSNHTMPCANQYWAKLRGMCTHRAEQTPTDEGYMYIQLLLKLSVSTSSFIPVDTNSSYAPNSGIIVCTKRNRTNGMCLYVQVGLLEVICSCDYGSNCVDWQADNPRMSSKAVCWAEFPLHGKRSVSSPSSPMTDWMIPVMVNADCQLDRI